ncbi:MAG: type IX secretion system membrane protein PorP/SprF [Bacteroidales bacterium]|nr:type IX secretion system membrane protein PorP/SprF [Bacteroidales bacterium]
MKTTVFYITIMCMLISLYMKSQQNAHYSQYIFNQLVINPAYAGAKGLVNVNTMYNKQWSGLEGSPRTLTISAEGPVFDMMGLGVHFIQDELGAQKQTAAYGSYAYRLRLSSHWRLSIGMALGITYNSIDGTRFTQNDEVLNDPAIPQSRVTNTLFDSKFGLFLFTKKFYAGLSVSELTANIKSPDDVLAAAQKQHFYFSTGYVFKLNEQMKMKPSIIVKEDGKALTNIDISNYVLYKNTVWFGLTYRTGAPLFTSKTLDNSLHYRDAAIAMLDYNITDNLRVGYAFQYSLTKLSNYYGHEILLGYYFAKAPRTKMLTPRYF